MRALLLKNPIPTRQDFAAGGSRIPILTRNPAQSTAGFQTFGLPTGKSSGGSANITHLGAIRMGDQDGNSPASAIFPDDIFYPPGQADRKYTQVSFENVGNNVYQPDSVQEAAATEALLRRLGDQQFKATERAPFEDYFATQRLARDTDEASRNAGLEDLGYSREIMRSIVAERRKGNEEDYLRRMLDAGMSQQDAQKEIDDVRRANALQESRKVEDRTHQAKLLIQRIAKSRGVLSSVNEPLTTTGAIENPQMNERMADMTNQPQNAYGSSPLDRDRIFKTPEYYKRVLRRSALTQEAGDEMSALANATAQAEGDFPTPTMLQGLERQDAIERRRDAVASRLDSAGTFRTKAMGKLPPISPLFESVLGSTKTGKGRFITVDTQNLSSFDSILALNQAINEEPAKLTKLKLALAGKKLTDLVGKPKGNIKEILRLVTADVVGSPSIAIPVMTEKQLDAKQVLDVLERIQLLSGTEVKEMRNQLLGYTRLEDLIGAEGDERLPEPIDARSMAKKLEDASSRLVREALMGAREDLVAELRAPGVRVVTPAGRGAPALGGAGGGAGRPALPSKTAVRKMKMEGLQALATAYGLSTEGGLGQLRDRLLALY